MLKEAPTNFYQYERDIKSFKNQKEKKLKYIMQIKPEQVTTIFKSDLDADVLLEILDTFQDQDNLFFTSNQEYLTKFVAAL